MHLLRCACLFQLRIFRLCSDENGNVGVGIFPQTKEFLIGPARRDRVACKSMGTAEPKMYQCSEGTIHHDAALINESLELPDSFAPLVRDQVGLTPQIRGVHER